jgi:hypothetical protein
MPPLRISQQPDYKRNSRPQWLVRDWPTTVGVWLAGSAAFHAYERSDVTAKYAHLHIFWYPAQGRPKQVSRGVPAATSGLQA